jgi:hypothetical protein
MSTFFDLRNIHAVVGSKPKSCSSTLKSPSTVYFTPIIGSNVIINNEEISLPDEKGSCYAIDVCTSEMTWVLSKEGAKAIKACSIFKNLKQAGWDIELKEVMFPGDKEKIPMVGSLWSDEQNGKHTGYDMMLSGKMKAKLNNDANDVKMALAYEGNVFVNTENINDVCMLSYLS